MANELKLKAAIAYIAGRCTVGKVKLFKLLYLADFTAFGKFGNSITDDVYQNFEMGPVPKTLWKRFEEITGGCVDVEKVESGMDRPELRMKPKAGVDYSVLSDDEKDILGSVVGEHGNKNGARLRDLTHKEIPYRVTRRGQDIPYYLAVYRAFVPLSKEQTAKIEANEAYISRLREALAAEKAA